MAKQKIIIEIDAKGTPRLKQQTQGIKDQTKALKNQERTQKKTNKACRIQEKSGRRRSSKINFDG